MTNIIGKIRHIGTFVVFGVLFFVFTSNSHAAGQIQSFDVDIQVNKDSSFTVKEIISYDFGTLNRHGIFRYIPTTHPQENSSFFKERYMEIDLASINVDDSNTTYLEQDEKDQLFIKIGEPDRTITGEHTYEIIYEVKGGISYFENDGAELYWDAISTEWDIPIHNVSVTLHDPDGIFKDSNSCYRGLISTQGLCDSTSTYEGGVKFEINDLGPHEGVTIAQSLDGKKVETVILERKNVVFLWIPALIIWFVALSIFVYRYRTKYKTSRTVIAQYEPYEDFKPMYTGLLFDGRLDPKDITAGILYLAQQGYLKIKKIDTKVLFFFEVDDYEINLLKPSISLDSEFQKEILKLLFGETAVVGDVITLQKLSQNVSKQRENQKLLKKLKKDLEKDLKNSGFFQVNIPITSLSITGTLVAIVLGFLFSDFGVALSASIVFLVIGLVGSLGVILFAYRRRTTKGYESLWYLKGFKEFLSVTEKERYEFHNAPEKSPEQFMEFLPYAIAFGVEEKWAKVFENITIPDPYWYDGGGGHFSAVGFSNSIGAFSTAFTSSSGSSASSGGGSVGGGGGGGGGGSW